MKSGHIPLRIVITGTPGTGKSVIAKKLSALLGLELVDLKKIVRSRRLADRKHEVDIKKLASALRFLQRKKGYVVEGHLACELRLPADFVFVLRTSPRVLLRRLSKRGYGAGKLNDNLAAELLDYCTQRVEQEYRKKPLELDTSRRTPASSMLLMAGAIRKNKKKLDTINYSHQLLDYVKDKI
jgi:adenylate kinase